MILAALALLLFADPARARYEQALRLFEAGRADAAITELRAVVAAVPKHAPAWKALGVIHAARGDFELAHSPFATACALEPQLPDACYYYARNQYVQNRFEASLETLEKALRDDPRPWRIHLAMAQAHEALGRAEDAERHFRHAVTMNHHAPKQLRMRPDEDPRVAYGIFLFRAGRTEDALRPLAEVVRDYPHSAAARLELGRTLYQLGRSREALPHLERAAALDSQSIPARLLLSKVLAQLGRPAEAERILEGVQPGNRPD